MGNSVSVSGHRSPSAPVGQRNGASGASWTPWTPATALDREIYNRSPDECPICMDTLEWRGSKPPKTWAVITSCRHNFHGKCLVQWFERTPLGQNCTCPCCRKIIRKNDLTRASKFCSEYTATRRSNRLSGSGIAPAIAPQPLRAEINQLPEVLRVQPEPPRPDRVRMGGNAPSRRVNARLQPSPGPSRAQRQPLAVLPRPVQPRQATRMNAEFHPRGPPLRNEPEPERVPLPRLAKTNNPYGTRK